MKAWITIVLCALLAPFTTGCAALSLFSETHTHTHHHNDCSDFKFQERLGRIESHIGIDTPVPSPTAEPDSLRRTN